MDLLDDSIVPEHARDVKAQAREFAEEHIEPNAEAYYESGDYPWELAAKGDPDVRPTLQREPRGRAGVDDRRRRARRGTRTGRR